jgi:hypothetical protein
MKYLRELRYYYTFKLTARVTASPDPTEFVLVSPKNINKYQLYHDLTDVTPKPGIDSDLHEFYKDIDKGAFSLWNHLNTSVGGSWDKHVADFEQLPVYQMLHDRFVKDVPWHDTQWFSDMSEVMNAGIPVYGCLTPDELLNKRLNYLEVVFEDMRLNGFKTQCEADDDYRNAGFSHEIQVNVARDGSFIFNSVRGQHRLSMAKILDIPQIPVVIVVRHVEWADIRENVLNTGTVPREYRDHPDLLQVLA